MSDTDNTAPVADPAADVKAPKTRAKATPAATAEPAPAGDFNAPTVVPGTTTTLPNGLTLQTF